MRTRKTLNMDTFHTVIIDHLVGNKKFIIDFGNYQCICTNWSNQKIMTKNLFFSYIGDIFGNTDG